MPFLRVTQMQLARSAVPPRREFGQQRVPDRLLQVEHVLAKGRTTATWQDQQLRSIGCGKVVHQGFIRAEATVGLQLLEQSAHQTGTPGTEQTGNKDIEAAGIEFQPTAQGVQPRDVDMTGANAFYILDGSYIDASLDEAIERYGSMDNYIRDGLGISNEEVTQLRATMLQE